MREDIKKWIDALESGEYPQTTHTLHNLEDGGYCCLGVYAVVNKIPGWDTMAVESNYNEETGDFNEGPTGVYAEIRRRVRDHVVESGIAMNDEGRSFKEIAEMIREEYQDAS